MSLNWIHKLQPVRLCTNSACLSIGLYSKQCMRANRCSYLFVSLFAALAITLSANMKWLSWSQCTLFTMNLWPFLAPHAYIWETRLDNNAYVYASSILSTEDPEWREYRFEPVCLALWKHPMTTWRDEQPGCRLSNLEASCVCAIFKCFSLSWTKLTFLTLRIKILSTHT